MNYDLLQHARFLRRQAERLEANARERIADVDQKEQWLAAARQANRDANEIDPRGKEHEGR